MNIKTSLFLPALIFAMSSLFIPRFLQADELSLTREVMLEKGYLPEPKTIVRAHDNGLIIAGTNNGQGWAIKTDAEGNFKWRHTISRADNPAPGDITYNRQPTYNSAATMPDDTVFLCGSMPGLKTGSALLTHLDKDGKVISEQSGLNGGELFACIASADDVVAIGTSVGPFEPNKHSTRFHSGRYIQQHYYWIISFDATGKPKWEKRVPVSDWAGSPLDGIQLQPVAGGGYVFASGRYGLKTEVVYIKRTGDVTTKLLDGHFTIVLSPNAESDLRLVSSYVELPERDSQTQERPTKGPFIRITLNNDLQETSRVIGRLERFTVRIAYRLPDQTLMLFGDGEPVGNRYARVMKLDSSLQHVQSIYLSPQESSERVETAVPLSKPGEFACARRADKAVDTKKVSLQDEMASDAISIMAQEHGIPLIYPGALAKSGENSNHKDDWMRLGVALDFVTLK